MLILIARWFHKIIHHCYYHKGCILPAGWEPTQVGNSFCSDQLNNPECDYDGGDCCGSNVNTDWCTECICFEDLNCASPLSLIGNGLCNDETNNAGCLYDGGDCCGECVNTDLCSECICQEGSEPANDHSCKLFSILNPTVEKSWKKLRKKLKKIENVEKCF